jgi:hypothetical protein
LLDPHFAHGGVFTFTIAGDDAGGNAIALLPHGKLLLVGSAKVNHAFQFVAVRLLPNGAPDPCWLGRSRRP